MPSKEWSKFNVNNKSLYLTLLVFEPSKLPDMFLIPSEVWKEPDEVFVDRNYDKLRIFKFEESIKEFIE